MAPSGLLHLLIPVVMLIGTLDAVAQTSEEKDSIVYVTNTGTKFHNDGCQYLRQSKLAISFTEAKDEHTPCSVCFPDQVLGTPKKEKGSVTVYVTRTGTKYHRDGCRYLSRSKIPINLDEAKRLYTACSVCSPP